MSDFFLPIQLQMFLAGMLFFFVGYAMAPMAYAKEVKWLTVYPLWVAKKLEVWAEKEIKTIVLFGFILGINSFSLVLDFMSGWVPVLPIIFAVWTGLNVGVVTFKTLKGEFYYSALLNPVALLELPAVFIAFALALGLNAQLLALNISNLDLGYSVFINSFLALVIPLLIIAAVVETALIKIAQKMEKP